MHIPGNIKIGWRDKLIKPQHYALSSTFYSINISFFTFYLLLYYPLTILQNIPYTYID